MTMQHSDFKIGTEFTTVTGRWRCTDVGTRVITAIHLDNPVVGAAALVNPGSLDSWFNGPPYAVMEVVFDENDFAGCELVT